MVRSAISAARAVDCAIKLGAPEPKDVKLALFRLGAELRGFALIDGENLIGWRYATADRENGPVLIAAERGEIAAQMLEQIKAAERKFSTVAPPLK